MSYVSLAALGQVPPPYADIPSLDDYLPTRDAIREIYAPYQEAIDAIPMPRGFDPVKFVTQGETLTAESAIQWSFDTIQQLQKHLNLSPPDLTRLQQIARGELKWLNEFGVPLTTIPTSVREAAIALATCAAFNACKQLGIPPEIGTLTVESLSDGELTDRDVMAMGGLAGGLAGSYLGSMIGIPPQLGGFVGGYLGKMLGSGLSDVLGIGGGSSARAERRRQDRERRRAVRGMLEQVRGQYQNLIVPLVRQMYWMVFDNSLVQIENQWQKSECDARARFPILWGAAGGLVGLPRDADPFLRYTFDGSRCPPADFRLVRSPSQCLDLSRPIAPGTRDGCPSVFRCPYPAFPNLGGGEVERVAQAFGAYNVWWVQPPARTSNTEAWRQRVPTPPESIVRRIANRLEDKEGCASDQCRRNIDVHVSQMVDEYKTQYLDHFAEAAGPDRVVEAAMRVQADLAASAAMYKALYALRGNTQMFMHSVGDAIRQAVNDSRENAALQMREQGRLLTAQRGGAFLSGLLNYGVPAAGALLLGAAVLRRRG